MPNPPTRRALTGGRSRALSSPFNLDLVGDSAGGLGLKGLLGISTTLKFFSSAIPSSLLPSFLFSPIGLEHGDKDLLGHGVEVALVDRIALVRHLTHDLSRQKEVFGDGNGAGRRRGVRAGHEARASSEPPLGGAPELNLAIFLLILILRRATQILYGETPSCPDAAGV